MTSKDYRVEVKIRNNWLLRKIEEGGYKSIHDFCRKNELRQQNVSKYITFRAAPKNQDGQWSVQFIKIAKALKCLPEDLCPPQHQSKALTKNKSSFEMDVSEVAGFLTGSSEDATPAIDHILKDEAVVKIGEMLTKLTPREERVLRIGYGLTPEGEEQTLENIAKQLDVSRERIRQMEAKAMRKLKHPKRSRKLLECAESFNIFRSFHNPAPRHYVPEWRKVENLNESMKKIDEKINSIYADIDMES